MRPTILVALLACGPGSVPRPDASPDSPRPDAHLACMRQPGTCESGWVPWRCDPDVYPYCPGSDGSVCGTDGSGSFCCMPCL